MIDERITPEMFAHGKMVSDLLHKGVMQLVGVLMGPGYKVTIILDREDDQNSMMIMSELDSDAALINVFETASAKVKAGTMIDASTPDQTH